MDTHPIPPAIEQAIERHAHAIKRCAIAWTDESLDIDVLERDVNAAHAALVAAIAAALAEARGITVIDDAIPFIVQAVYDNTHPRGTLDYGKAVKGIRRALAQPDAKGAE